MSTLKTQAIVIKRRNIGESDRILTLFTQNEGIICAIAKGSRKPKSRFASSTNLFTIGNYILSTGKTFFMVSEVEIEDSYYLSNETNLDSIIITDAMAETILRLFPEKYPIPDIYHLFTDSVKASKGVQINLVYIYFISHLLKKLGSFPELNFCINCREKLSNKVYFSSSAGGLYCMNCQKDASSIVILNNNSIKLWRILSECEIEKLPRIRVEDDVINDLFNMINGFLSINTQLELRSLKL